LGNLIGKLFIEFMRVYDLEERTEKFAADCRSFVRSIEKDIPNFEDSKQLVRSSGSVAANYIEANESLGKKDFLMRLKISRKEAKESLLWLRLIKTNQSQLILEKERLLRECNELRSILSTIINKNM
jgi:four helix bundle protein